MKNLCIRLFLAETESYKVLAQLNEILHIRSERYKQFRKVFQVARIY